MEINHSPSFSVDSSLDLEIKKNLMIDTFNLLNLQNKDKKM